MALIHVFTICMCTVTASTRKSSWLCSSFYLCRSWSAKKRQEKKKSKSKVNALNETLPRGRSSGLVETPVCFMNPHTHCASAPPSAYQGENSQGQESEPRDSEMVRTRVRTEKEVTDLYQPPHPLWIPPHLPPHRKIKAPPSHCFYDSSACRWVKTATSALRGEATSQTCVYSRNRSWWLYAPESERNIRSQLADDNSKPWPAVSTRYGPVYCCAVPNWTPPVQPTPRTPRHWRHMQPRTTQTDPKQTDLPSQKVPMCCRCFPICVHTGRLWVFIVGMHYVLREKKKKTASYHVKTEAALFENSVCFPLASGLRM